jgi:hypothetical protein
MELIEKVKEVVKLVETIGLSDDSLKDLLLEVIEDDQDERLLKEDTEIQEGRTVSNKDIREAIENVAAHNKEIQDKAYEDMDRDQLRKSCNYEWNELAKKEMESFSIKWWYPFCEGFTQSPRRYDTQIISSPTVQSIPEFKFSNITFVVDPIAPNCAHGFRYEDGSYICSKEKCDCFEKENECKK